MACHHTWGSFLKPVGMRRIDGGMETQYFGLPMGVQVARCLNCGRQRYRFVPYGRADYSYNYRMIAKGAEVTLP